MARLQKHTPLVVLVLIAGFWLGLVSISGSLTSGYHFMDDHEIVRIHIALRDQQQPFLAVVSQWLQSDFAFGRFRPVYYLHRILVTWIFGVNWWLWSLYVVGLGIFTTMGLWVFARQLQFTVGEALLLAALTTLGPHAAVWWQLGPPETLGMAVLAIALLLLARVTRPIPPHPLNEGLWIATVMVLSLCKESFIVLIPALLLWRLWLTQQQIHSWPQALRRTAIAIAVLGSVVVAELLVIKIFIGLGGPGYGGVIGVQWQDFWQALVQLSQVGAGWVGWPGYGVLVAIALSRRTLKADLGLVLLVVAAILLPQAFIYAKTGITHRYLLPGMLGCAFLAVWVYRNLHDQSRLLQRLVLAGLALSLTWQLHTVWLDVQRFASEGRSIQALFRTLESQTARDSRILLVSHPRSYAEWSLALKFYLAGISDRPNLYLQVYSAEDSSFYQLLRQEFEQRTVDQLTDPRDLECITILPELHNAFLKRSTDWFIPQNYRHLTFGPFYRTINPKSEIHLYCKN